MVTVRGPWLGMEERDNHRNKDKCEIAMNCFFADGNITPRKGFGVVGSTTAMRQHVHPVYRNGKLINIIGIGPQTNVNSAPTIKVKIWERKNTSEKDQFAIIKTADLSIEAQRDFQCSFVDVPLAIKDKTSDKVVASHTHVLACTSAGVFAFDIDGDITDFHQVDGSADGHMIDDLAIRFDDQNIAYWEDSPKANIATKYAGTVVYAGFRDGFSTHLTNPVEDDQDIVPQQIINEIDGATYGLGPEWLCMSDPYDPLGIRADSIWSVGKGEKITGLANFMESLIVFTEKNTYVGNGLRQSFMPKMLAAGVGCVSHQSIVQVGNVLYFMSHDGVYALQGAAGGGAIKISKPIDSWWSGRKYSTHIPSETVERLSAAHWPFTLSGSKLKLSHGLHVKSLNQIWWSLPLSGGSYADGASFPATLVWDYVNLAWSFMTSTYTFVDRKVWGMCSGFTEQAEGVENVFTADCSGYIWQYGRHIDEIPGVSTGGVPVVFVSGRIFRDQDNVAVVRPIRLKVLSKGKTPTTPPKWFVEGEEAHFDSQVEGATLSSDERQATSGTLELHPDTDNTYFFGTAKFGTDKFQERDWFSTKIEPGSVKSRSFRFGFVDYSAARAPWAVMQSYSLEYYPEDPR